MEFLKYQGIEREIIDEYFKRTDLDYSGNPVLKVFNNQRSDKIITGSNIPSLVLLDQVAREYGKRIKTLRELEPSTLTGFHIDHGLVLNSLGNPNSILAQSLTNQLRQFKNYRVPLLISLTGLRLKRESSSELGLSFELTENGELTEAEILLRKGEFYFYNENLDFKTGLPLKIYNGKLGDDNSKSTQDNGKTKSLESTISFSSEKIQSKSRFKTRKRVLRNLNNQGLTRAYLNPFLDQVFDFDEFESYYEGGRIVLTDL